VQCRVVVAPGRAALLIGCVCFFSWRRDLLSAAGAGAGAGAADGGDDVLLAVEKLSEVMYFDVLQLLGQGSNGAVFKVGAGFALGLPRRLFTWLGP
jgi:hypothetical protein